MSDKPTFRLALYAVDMSKKVASDARKHGDLNLTNNEIAEIEFAIIRSLDQAQIRQDKWLDK